MKTVIATIVTLTFLHEDFLDVLYGVKTLLRTTSFWRPLMPPSQFLEAHSLVCLSACLLVYLPACRSLQVIRREVLLKIPTWPLHILQCCRSRRVSIPKVATIPRIMTIPRMVKISRAVTISTMVTIPRTMNPP